ncbi:hypothetical protein ABK040_016745 [Willaertia magna]
MNTFPKCFVNSQLTTRNYKNDYNNNNNINDVDENILSFLKPNKSKLDVSKFYFSQNLRIQGGSLSLNNEFPHMTSIQFSSNGRYYHMCGGSIIDDKWILSAAHCMYGDDGELLKPNQITIVAGNRDLLKCPFRISNTPNSNGCIRKKVKRIIVHENYDADRVVNDISLVELEVPIEFATNIRPMYVPKNRAPSGSMVTLSGWGNDPDGNSDDEYILRKTEMPVIADSDCNALGLGMSSRRKQVCAGTDGTDACSGDSGSPLFYAMTDNPAYLFQGVGLVSYGLKCAGKSSYNNRGVYTSVPDFREWILQKSNLKFYNESTLELKIFSGARNVHSFASFLPTALLVFVLYLILSVN